MNIEDPFILDMMLLCGGRLGSCVLLVPQESGGIMPLTDAELSQQDRDRNIRIAAVVLSRACMKPMEDPPRAS